MRKIILIVAGVLAAAVLAWVFTERSSSTASTGMSIQERGDKALSELRQSGREDLAGLVALLSTANWRDYKWAVWRFSKNNSLPLNLSTPDEIRAQAVSTLRLLGTNARPAAPAILPLLLGKDTAIHAAAAMKCIGASGEAKSVLLETSTNANLTVRLGCSMLLADLVPICPSAVAIACDMARDPNPSVRMNAVQSLGRAPGDVTQPALVLASALNDTSPNVRQEAAGSLFTYGLRATNAKPAILAALEKNDGPDKETLKSLVFWKLAPEKMLSRPASKSNSEHE